MNIVVGDMASPSAPTFLTQGFRPFFWRLDLWSAAPLALWIVMFATGSAVSSRFDPLAWHIHEMLFGFVMAAVAGFLLTAIPNWTKRLPVSGFPLARLAGLWLLGRVACLISALVPAWLAIAADLSFPMALVGLVTREIVAGWSWRNLPMVAPVTVLGIANLLMHLEADGVAVPIGLGWRLGLAAVIVLISVVAGRIVPSFTWNWLAKRGDPGLPAVHGWIDRAALGILHGGLFGRAFFPAFRAVGALPQLVMVPLLQLLVKMFHRGAAIALLIQSQHAQDLLGRRATARRLADPPVAQTLRPPIAQPVAPTLGLFGFQHPETTPSSIPTTSRTAPCRSWQQH